MNKDDFSKKILSPNLQYANVKVNDTKIISSKQTLTLVLGSCVSTVFVGKGEGYILGANHIFLAEPMLDSKTRARSALTLIDEILTIFNEEYNLGEKDILCLYLVGGGNRNGTEKFSTHLKNIKISEKIIRNKNYGILIKDVNSYFYSSLSLSSNRLSVFVENMIQDTHLSFTIDLDRLFDWYNINLPFLPASALEPDNPGFENFIEEKIITFVTGEKNRKYEHLC